MARENRFFLLSSDLAGCAGVSVDGRLAVSRYGDLAGRIEALCGREAAELFAEPMLPRGAAASAAISWYGPFEGRPLELAGVDEVARKPVAERLRERLQALAPGFDDAELGPLLIGALNVASSKDIVAVGGEPMLVNWGHLPQDVGDDPARRLDHFARTIGVYAPELTPRVARALGVSPSPAAAAPTPAPSPPSPASPSPAPTGAPPPRMRAPATAAARAPSPVRALLIACGVAAAILIALLLPGVLAYPDLSDRAGADEFEAERLRASNRSLEAQLDALRKANGAGVCRADNKAPVPEMGDPAKPPPKMDILPKPPDKASLPVKPNETPKAETIAALLEKSVVFVFVVEKNGKVATGSGFFISPTLVVTNRHVIENALNEQVIFIASKFLNGARRTRVAFKTPPKQPNKGPQPDFAVLELPHPAEAAPLKMGPPPPKLSTAYIAGYPGFLVEVDSDEAKFIDGLKEALKDGVSDEQLEARRFNVPSVDLRYGRINNLMLSGVMETPIIVHDMQLAHGNSGGPLIDGCGRIGGVNTLFFADENQVGNVALSVEALRKFLNEQHVEYSADDSACDVTAQEKRPDAPAPTPSPPAK